MTEPKFKFTTKIDGDLFTVHGDSLQEFQANLDAASQSGIGANIRNMVTSVNNTGALNSVLGAMPTDPAQNPEPQQNQGPPAQQAPTQENPWGQAPPANQWGQQQSPQQGGNNWGQPPQQQNQGGWGQPQGGGDWRADPSLQPPHLTPPTTPFGPAKYWGKTKPDGKQSRAWVDPRPYQQTKNMPKESKFWQWINDSEL